MNRIRLNMGVAFLTKILIIVTGIISQRFVLTSFGSEINGLTSSISQFLSYFTLLEAGLGIASLQALYKPLANNDKEKVDGILAATSIQYRCIGLAFLFVTVILSAAMPFISHSSLPNGLVFLLTLLMGSASVLNYLFIGRYQVMLRADQRVYVLDMLDSVLGISFRILNILMMNGGWSILSVYAVGLLSPATRIIFLAVYFKINYPDLSYNVRPDFQETKKRKFVLVHQIVGMISAHTDVTIITLFSTLAHVSVYSVYNLIYANVNTVITSTFYSSVEPSFGRLVGNKDAKLKPLHRLYEILYTFTMSWLMSCVLVMTIPFISLYTKGVTDIEYTDPVLAVLFMLSTYLGIIRIPALILVNTTGAFQETQKGAIWEAVINLTVSLPAYYFMGIRGLLVGTCISLLYRMLDVELYVYRNILHEPLLRFVKLLMLNVALIFVVYWFFTFVRPIVVNGWRQWFLFGIIVAAINTVFFAVLAVMIYGTELIRIIKQYKKMK